MIPNTILIAGGGTAGWLTAVSLSLKLDKSISIKLIESPTIGTIGVGEATIPSLKSFHDSLGINENEFMRYTDSTLKYSIEFSGWSTGDSSYHHSFDLDKNKPLYAYHLDSGKYAEYLREIAVANGVKHIQGDISEVTTNDNGIQSIELKDGSFHAADLFVDCTGFKSLLLGQELGVKFNDWSHLIPSDSAWAVQTEKQPDSFEYTKSIARPIGWQWTIPLTTRTGNGIVYSSKYCTDEEALETLLDNLNTKVISEPRKIKFQTGCREEFWHKNCVGIGLSSGFIEPLESTTIHLIIVSINKLIRSLITNNSSPHASYNRSMASLSKDIRDFIIAHYHINRRNEMMWKDYQQMVVPYSVKSRIDHFVNTKQSWGDDSNFFQKANWEMLLLGQLEL